MRVMAVPSGLALLVAIGAVACGGDSGSGARDGAPVGSEPGATGADVRNEEAAEAPVLALADAGTRSADASQTGVAETVVAIDCNDTAVTRPTPDAGVDGSVIATPDLAIATAGFSVSVAPGESAGTASVEVELADGSEPIVSMVVVAIPDNVTGSADTRSVSLAGLASHTSHSFGVTVTTVSGKVLSATTSALAFYDVVETFVEPECEHDTVFMGSFTFDTDGRTVSNLRGTLTEAMFAGPPTVSLTHQLSSQAATLGGASGQLVATFALPTTDTFSGGGFAPGGTRTLGNENAYALVFVNSDDPAVPLTSDQVDRLAYADCTPLGLMGKMCMTGTSVAAYGRAGTMAAYPVSQVTTLR